jgi:hypothetical protein
MRYCDIEPMYRPTGVALRGCLPDGLGCTGGKRCSFNSDDPEVQHGAWTADGYCPDFHCVKRASAENRATTGWL